MLLLCLQKNLMMEGLNHRCFVCQMDVTKENSELNTEVNLPVCNHCKGTKKKRKLLLNFLTALLMDWFVAVSDFYTHLFLRFVKYFSSRFIPSSIFSMELAYEKRKNPSPFSPKSIPGVTPTCAFSSISKASV